MKITNTYSDFDGDVWCKVGVNVFFLTSSIRMASRNAECQFNDWIDNVFSKIEIGTKHD